MPNVTATRLLGAIAVAIALSLGSQFFIPIALGLILAMVLQPLVGLLHRARIPAAVGATVAIVLAICTLVIVVALLERPLRSLAAEIPKTLVSASSKLGALGIRLPGSDATQDTAPHPNDTTTRPSRDSTARTPRAPATAAPSQDTSGKARPDGNPTSPPSGLAQTITRVFGVTASTLFGLVEVFLLAFFILAAGDLWRTKLKRATQSAELHERLVTTTRAIQRVVLRYLLMNVLINAAQGVLVALLVSMLGYSSPALWGFLTFIAEFVPYFGGAAMVALLFLTGLASGHGLTHAVLAPAAYLLITTLQNNLVSPAAYGRGLRLNPTAILVAVMFWGLVWGIAGVFLAVPLLAAMRIVAENSRLLKPAAIFMAE